MIKITICFMCPTIIAILFSMTLASGQTVSSLNQKFTFSLRENKCPDFAKIAGDHWIPEAIIDYKRRLIKCEPSIKSFSMKDNVSLAFVQYLYHFKEDSDFISRQQFNYIVEKSAKSILWKYDTLEYPTGALENISVMRLKDHSVLEFEFFTGGTAGYWEEYFTFDKGKLYAITESFRDSIELFIPKGYSIRRVRVDIKKLTATVHLATENDANCCPSGRLDVTLHFEKNDLKLNTCKFSADKP